MADLKITNASIYDGSGSPAVNGEIAISNGRITGVGECLQEPAALEFDAGGRAVAPGFIDSHTHSDISILSSPECLSAICQGVTTQVVGLCGYSAAPVVRETLDSFIKEEPLYNFPDITWDWDSIGGYLAAVRKARPATNIVTFIGHGTLRRAVVGEENRAPTDREQSRMRAMLRDAFREGARGFTTGLSYAPGCYAAMPELVELTGVAAVEGWWYHTHMRYGTTSVTESLAEALQTAEGSGVSMNVSHLYPYANSGISAQSLIDMVEAARRRGVEVSFDLTVFRRGGGPLPQRIPLWARDGGYGRLVERILDEALRRRIETELEEAFCRDLGWTEVQWHDILVCKVEKLEHLSWLGRSIADIAVRRHEPPATTALRLVAEDGQYWVAPPSKAQEDLDLLMAHPLCVPIGDGICAHPEKHKTMAMPHTFGTFPYVLGFYVRERHVLPLEEAIHRMTELPARRLRLDDRGRVAPGYAADLVVFDPGTVRNNADNANPTAPPTGIERVMTNGEWVVIDGRPTGRRPGKTL